jgi:hypothetical protein
LHVQLEHLTRRSLSRDLLIWRTLSIQLRVRLAQTRLRNQLNQRGCYAVEAIALNQLGSRRARYYDHILSRPQLVLDLCKSFAEQALYAVALDRPANLTRD